MPKAFTIDSEMELTRRLAVLEAVAKLVAGGQSQNIACQLAQIKPATYVRWRAAFAAGGRDALRPGVSSGRKPLAAMSEAELLEAKRTYVATNRARGKGSKTTALRRFAQSSKCSPAVREAILKERSSKHKQTRFLRRQLDVIEGVIDYNRSPNKLTLAMAQNTGSMRMKYEADSRGNIALRRLRAGERQSWDDGTINMVCWVPWSIGGCKCSDRWGVKVGRFQTLLGIDDAWDYIPGFSFVMRAQGSYRAFDVAGAMGRAWMDDILPESANLERGVWESNRAEQFYKFTGVQVNHVYSPNHKLVEPLWGRLWTEMSLYGGQVGRYRGEMERENALLMKCQAGTQDPRQCFPSLLDALNAIERGLLIQNSEPKESRKYGKWIPQERYAEQLAERPRKALDREMSWLLAPEVHRWKVKRNGVVGGQVRCPLGPSIPYYFACDHLWDFIGARVDVHFDPYLSPIRATITLAEPHRGRPAGTIVSTKAECIVDVPMLQRLGDAWSHEENDGVPLEKALRYRQAYFQAVRTEWRSFTPEGKRKNMFSAVDDGAGQRREAGTLDFAPQADRTDAPIEISTRRRAGALPPRTAGVAPAQPARVKPEEVDLTAMVDRNRSRLEEAKSRGALTEF